VRVLAVVVGACLYALALPPYDHSWAGWLTLVPLLSVIRGCSPGQAFAYGALYGFAAPWAITWWLTQALARYFATNMVFAAAAMSLAYTAAVASMFGLFATGAAILLRKRPPLLAQIAVAALWATTDLLRARVVGQPWGLLGYTQHMHIGLIQVAAVGGVYGVSFLVALGNAAIAHAISSVRSGEGVRGVRGLIPPALIVGALWSIGAFVVATSSTGMSSPQRIAVVQTNVAPAFEWTRSYTERQLMAHVNATRRVAESVHPDLIIWPENAVPRYLETEPAVAAQLGTLARSYRADLVFGGPRHEAGRTYNSVRLITAKGRYGGHYDKKRLVLFAEATPLTGAVGSPEEDSPRAFSPGDGPGVLRASLPIGVSICHEILYPDLVIGSVLAGAGVLVNVSNDGWLDAGYGSASRQHFAMALFRAVETRRYLVRAATTGVSGVVDPYGRVVDSLAPGVVGVMTGVIEGRTVLTPYVRLGDAFAFACALFAASALFAGRSVLSMRGAPTAAPVSLAQERLKSSDL